MGSFRRAATKRAHGEHSAAARSHLVDDSRQGGSFRIGVNDLTGRRDHLEVGCYVRESPDTPGSVRVHRETTFSVADPPLITSWIM